jgi:pimeloyl-ACP methyl ester carboxylesterase
LNTVIVYVHGLWMTGVEGAVLRRRLANLMNADVPFFAYPSLSSIGSNALRLRKRLQQIPADMLHLVGHSLGGIVILRMFEELRVHLPPGRVVLLGSPVAGSRVALRLATWRFGSMVLGRSAREEFLVQRERIWNENRELGVIAGTRQLGVGRLVHSDPDSSDGTVFVEETRLRGMKQHLLMHVSHTGLPFSSAVARQTAAFLRNGRFEPF